MLAGMVVGGVIAVALLVVASAVALVVLVRAGALDGVLAADTPEVPPATSAPPTVPPPAAVDAEPSSPPLAQDGPSPRPASSPRPAPSPSPRPAPSPPGSAADAGAEPPSRPPAPTKPGVPARRVSIVVRSVGKRLTRSEVDAQLAAAKPAVEACYQLPDCGRDTGYQCIDPRQEGRLSYRIFVGTDGTVVQMYRGGGGIPLAQCLPKVFERMRFSPYTREPGEKYSEIDLHLVLQGS